MHNIPTGLTGLSDKQFGFRRSRSTLAAIGKVMRIATKTTTGVQWRERTKQYCSIVTLAIEDSASWFKIRQAMFKFGVPGYLRKIPDDYLDNGILLYDTNEGVQRYAMPNGVSQGSVPGTILWNAMYNGVLSIGLPQGVTFVGYASTLCKKNVLSQSNQFKNG